MHHHYILTFFENVKKRVYTNIIVSKDMASDHCVICKRELICLPYICKYCGKHFCVEHRLPEKHRCEHIKKVMENTGIVHTEDLINEIIEFEKVKRKESSNPLEKIDSFFKSKRKKKRKEG